MTACYETYAPALFSGIDRPSAYEAPGESPARNGREEPMHWQGRQ